MISHPKPLSGPALRKRNWSAHEDRLIEGVIQPNLRVGIAATFTSNNLVPFLGSHLIGECYLPAISLGPYNQIFQACLNPEEFFGKGCDAAVLLWRVEDLMFAELSGFLAGDKDQAKAALQKLDHLIGTVATLRKKFTGTIILGLPPNCSHGPAGLSSLESPTSAATLHELLVTHLKNHRIAGVHLFDFHVVQNSFGIDVSLDWRQWYLYRQPFSDRFLDVVGKKLSRIILAARRPPKKCIVLDADNTLWGGIIGEDGLEGIALGDEFPGTAFRDFQTQLLHLKSQGVLLAIASKNNEADVWEVFDKHDGMILRREDISAWAINWDPKAENILQIAKKLNIGSDSLVFIDDNAMEIEYMRQARPEVTSVHLPDEPADILPAIQALTLFDTFEITEEDRHRGAMMAVENERTALGQENLTREGFQRALEMRISFAPACAEDLGRVTQLINKTNQFNLTTVRRSLDEVRELCSSADQRVYALRVWDKFGDYGLTGVVITDNADPKIWKIDTLLLSCRVLGRGVETALLASLASDARSEGAVQLTASFIPTAKNSPAAEFLPSHGFKSIEGERWGIALSEIPEISPFVKRG
jgi:FkbH-like protein